MAHNYDKTGLPDGMELDEMHTHSDGETQAAVNAKHACMTAGPGSSEEQYPDTSKDAESELPDEQGGHPVMNYKSGNGESQ